MAKLRNKGSVDSFIFLGGVFLGLLVLYSLWSYINPSSLQTHLNNNNNNNPSSGSCTSHERTTFYDDPKLSYSITSKPIRNWDEKRQDWLKRHPFFAHNVQQRVIMVTGSQPSPCKNTIGDHLLLRSFKNKVDYCRLHGYDIFYNDALLHPKMRSFWAKLPVVKAAMLAHPEAEWIWWVDSDALITDMEFKLPLDKYKAHNLVVHGWANLVYEKKSWTSLNAGVFLIRNCQWSMDFIDVWASMGPQSPDYVMWGQVQRSIFKDKLFPESDDQTGLIYLIFKEKEKWADKIYLEAEYYFEGYWVDIVGAYENVSRKYEEIEKDVGMLRRRHGEKETECYGEKRESYLIRDGGKGSWRRPFVTHFTGCQPCSGEYNEMYSAKSCWDGMVRALNFADNQVLRNYGFIRRDLLDSGSVSPVPFDYPAAA